VDVFYVISVEVVVGDFAFHRRCHDQVHGVNAHAVDNVSVSENFAKRPFSLNKSE